MRKRQRKKSERREHEVQPAVPVITTVADRKGPGAKLVPGVTDEDPNTGRRVEKAPKK